MFFFSLACCMASSGFIWEKVSVSFFFFSFFGWFVFLLFFFFFFLLMLHFQYLGDTNYLILCSPVLCHMIYAKVFHTPLHYLRFKLIKHCLFFALTLDFFLC